MQPQRLKDALRKARIDAAERTGVVVDLHDAEVARLELLNEALDPLFAEIPAEVDLFDRGISRAARRRGYGSTPSPTSRWGATSASIASCRTPATAARCWPRSCNIPEIVEAVTKYLAQRLIERERALADNGTRRSATSRPRGVARAPARVAGAPSARSCSACWRASAILVGARRCCCRRPTLTRSATPFRRSSTTPPSPESPRVITSQRHAPGLPSMR